MWLELYDHQRSALDRMKNGCILNGGVGSGKSRTSIAYYYITQGGRVDTPAYTPMDKKPADLYIITTARKRDTKEWESELINFGICNNEAKMYDHNVIIDSWNNIAKYRKVYNAFFIFDEQRVVGKGLWVKSFLEISKKNKWILLSATPGDTWSDYAPVFIANGFFRNKTEFYNEHVVWDYVSKFPKIKSYLNTGKLIRLRREILVDMDDQRTTKQHHTKMDMCYDKLEYKDILKTRWNKETNEPFKSASELCYALRKIPNSSPERVEALMDIVAEKKKVIVFYSFDYELALLKSVQYWIPELNKTADISEWNGHKHEPIPDSDAWVYLVNYSAGAEGWNCIQTDTIVFYSQTYSYKTLIQACGRIDRINTPFKDLYYYHFCSTASIDLAIRKALERKKEFNVSGFVNGTY